MITLRQLSILVEVSRSGSFRRCGEKLGLSQVSVSEHIRMLEHRLKVQLFVRTPGAPPTLTDEGRIAVQHAERTLEAVSDLVAAVTPAPSGRTLRMAIHSFLMGDLPPVFDALRLTNPLIKTETETGALLEADLQELIKTRKLDLAVFFSPPGHVSEGGRHLRDEPLAIFVGANHPFATQSRVPVSELSDAAIVRLSNPLGDVVAEALKTIGIVQSRVAIATEDFGLLVHSLRGGDGYACMFEATEETCRSMGLAKLDMAVPMPSLQVQMLTRASLERDPVVVDLLARMAQAWENRGRGVRR